MCPRGFFSMTCAPTLRRSGILRSVGFGNLQVGSGRSEENWYWHMDLDARSVTLTALQVLMCSPHLSESDRIRYMDILLKRKGLKINSSCYRPTDLSEAGYQLEERLQMTPLQLAAYLGNRESLQLLLTKDNIVDDHTKPKISEMYSGLYVAILQLLLTKDNIVDDHTKPKISKGYSALHVAAMAGRPDAIRKILDTRKFDPIDLDPEGNTVNNKKQIADPGLHASPDYSKWWYEELAKETQEAKTNLNAAANAVSVTAALVATASYVGPLQPPLGYAAQSDSLIDKMQVGILSVRIFIVCNTLAFYLAAIMLSLFPSLPMPQESILDELKLIRRTVTVGVILLILSIVAVLFAFASASIAVIPDEGSWNHGASPQAH